MASAGFTGQIAKDQFLQLFATQLKYQDPMEPTGQQEFLQQLAQFSTVEGIENLNSGFRDIGGKLDKLVTNSTNSADLSRLQTMNAGAGLLGKSVRYGASDTDIGVVSEIKPDNGQILVRIGGTLMPISNVQSVANSVGDLSSSN